MEREQENSQEEQLESPGSERDPDEIKTFYCPNFGCRTKIEVKRQDARLKRIKCPGCGKQVVLPLRLFEEAYVQSGIDGEQPAQRTCPNCKRLVTPTIEGVCPVCRLIMDKGILDEATRGIQSQKTGPKLAQKDKTFHNAYAGIVSSLILGFATAYIWAQDPSSTAVTVVCGFFGIIWLSTLFASIGFITGTIRQRKFDTRVRQRMERLDKQKKE